MSLAALAFPLLRPALHALEAETAHRATIGLLKLVPAGPPAAAGPLAIEAFGLRFANPRGLAAGFDKTAEVPDAMLGQGFGFVEIGTVTPKPQAGNPRPRLFRLVEDRAVINRMGFNNDGHAAALARLLARQGRAGLIGVNIGANKDSPDRMADYVAGIEAFSGVASYLTVNISSPNTPGLRALQSRAELQELLDRLNAARVKQARRPPMLLKIAPDLRDDELEDVARCCEGGAVDGIIVSNTTLSRDGLRSPLKAEAGGLSGPPLFALSTARLAALYRLTDGRIPLVGAGGIDSAETAFAKIEAGASLLQLYSALVYQGPALVTRILRGVEAKLAGTRLAAVRGRAVKALTRG
jgi:dihydroorotate dehydrogenase